MTSNRTVFNLLFATKVRLQRMRSGRLQSPATPRYIQLYMLAPRHVNSNSPGLPAHGCDGIRARVAEQQVLGRLTRRAAPGTEQHDRQEETTIEPSYVKKIRAGGCWKFLAVALGVLLLVACSRTAPVLAPLSRDAVVLAFGDSITFGTGAAPGESYPAVLARLIDRTVINAGIPGEVTAGGLERLPEVLDSNHPALLLLCLGGNDFLRKLGDQQAAANIRTMVQLAKGRGVDVVLIGVPKPSLAPAPPPFYREIAREVAVPYEGDVLKRILTHNSLKADYIHPNAQGYKVMAEAIAALLKENGAL